MRVASYLLIFSALAISAPVGFAGERSAPLDPIAGFELRLLDKKFPVQITVGGKTETHGAPVWIFMPETGLVQAPLDAITQPADLDGGTTLLPAPPDGFGLRALNLPIRERFILADGREAIVEIPVFVYFRRVETLTPEPVSAAQTISGAGDDSALKKDPATEAKAELDQLRGELVEFHRQFSALVPLMGDDLARARLTNLVRQLGSVVAAESGRADGKPEESNDGPIKL
ncbi:MAG: hypothetical protein ABSE59_04510 [Opitutaceae bacterium]|jgi:hypothetical protein